jgi:hypothetical protein
MSSQGVLPVRHRGPEEGQRIAGEHMQNQQTTCPCHFVKQAHASMNKCFKQDNITVHCL